MCVYIIVFIQAVQALLDHGADVNKKSKDGMTPLCIASFWGYAHIAKALLQNGWAHI